MKHIYVYAILVAVIIALLYWGYNTRHSAADDITALHQQITTTRNKLGQEVARKNAVVASNKQTLLKVKGLEGTNRRLQMLVREKEGIIAAISSSHTTEVRYITDEVEIIRYKDSLPVYTTEINDKWTSGSVTMSHDSLDLDIQVFNDFDWSFERQKNLFVADTITVEVKSLNPYTSTRDFSSYKFSPKKNKIGIGPGVGVGLGSDFRPQLQVGFYLTYNLVSL